MTSVVVGEAAGSPAATSKISMALPDGLEDGDAVLAIMVGPPTHPTNPWKPPSPGWAWTKLDQHVHMGRFFSFYQPGMPNPVEFDADTQCSAGVVIGLKGVTRLVLDTGQPCCERAGDGLCKPGYKGNVGSPCYQTGCSGLPTPQFSVEGAGLIVHAAACHAVGAPIDQPLGFDLEYRGTSGKIALVVSTKLADSLTGPIEADPSRSGWVHGMSTLAAFA